MDNMENKTNWVIPLSIVFLMISIIVVIFLIFGNLLGNYEKVEDKDETRDGRIAQLEQKNSVLVARLLELEEERYNKSSPSGFGQLEKRLRSILSYKTIKIEAIQKKLDSLCLVYQPSKPRLLAKIDSLKKNLLRLDAPIHILEEYSSCGTPYTEKEYTRTILRQKYNDNYVNVSHNKSKGHFWVTMNPKPFLQDNTNTRVRNFSAFIDLTATYLLEKSKVIQAHYFNKKTQLKKDIDRNFWIGIKSFIEIGNNYAILEKSNWQKALLACTNVKTGKIEKDCSGYGSPKIFKIPK